jgi:hypothetical protein
MLGHVFPHPALNHLEDRVTRDTEFCPELFVCDTASSVTTTDVDHLGFGQLDVGTGWRRYEAPFGYTVANVGELRAGPEVGRVAAFPIVASVADVDSIRDRSVGEYVRQPRRYESRALAVTSDTETTPTATVEFICPFPTISRSLLIDIGPKPFDLLRGKLWVRHVDLLTRSRWRRAGGVSALPGFLLPQFYQKGVARNAY